MTFDEYLKQDTQEDLVVDISRERAKQILAKLPELSPQDRFNKLKSQANCYAISCIYDIHGYAGVSKWIQLGKKNRSKQ